MKIPTLLSGLSPRLFWWVRSSCVSLPAGRPTGLAAAGSASGGGIPPTSLPVSPPPSSWLETRRHVMWAEDSNFRFTYSLSSLCFFFSPFIF